MPTYEYSCDSCGNDFEVFQKMSDEPVQVCPKCGHYRKIDARARIALCFDGFEELFAEEESGNILDFPGYTEKLEQLREKTGEKDGAVCGAVQHSRAHAPDQEHGPGRGTEHAHAGGVLFRQRARPLQLQETAAAHGISGKHARQDTEGGAGGQFYGVHQRRKPVRKAGSRRRENPRTDEKGKQHGQHRLSPQCDPLGAGGGVRRG